MRGSYNYVLSTSVWGDAADGGGSRIALSGTLGTPGPPPTEPAPLPRREVTMFDMKDIVLGHVIGSGAFGQVSDTSGTYVSLIMYCRVGCCD